MSVSTGGAASLGKTSFRPIQYLGSKYRILDQVSDAVNSVADPRRPMGVDLFAGSGVVARRMAYSRPVLAADVQEYSRVLTSALLAPHDLDCSAITREVGAEIDSGMQPWLASLVNWEGKGADSAEWSKRLTDDIENGSLELLGWGPSGQGQPMLEDARHGAGDGTQWTVLRHYGGVFFSYRQAANLDVIASVVRRLEPSLRDTALAALLSTASELVSSVGSHFAQPIRPRDRHGNLKMGQLRNVATVRRRDAQFVFASKLRHFASLEIPPYRGVTSRRSFEAVLDSLPSEVGVVYADPPYTREHYSRFYHVLETIALGDDPGVSTVRTAGTESPSRGIYRLDRHQSPFSIVSQAPEAFDRLFGALSERNVSMVLSYSPVPENDKPRARVIAMDALLQLAKERFRSVHVIEASGIRHSKFNHASKNAPLVDEAEVLIVAKNL